MVVAEAGPKPDFSLWTPEDDLLLKNAMEAGAAIEALAKGAVKFSKRYTAYELRERWGALLYDKDISEEAAVRMLRCETLAASLGKGANPKRSRESIELCRRHKLNNVRTHYYKMCKRVAPEHAQLDHLLPNHDMEDHKELDPCIEENAFSQMVRLLAVGGVTAVIQALPCGNDSIQEDSSLAGLLVSENLQMQTLDSVDRLNVSQKGDIDAQRSETEVHAPTGELGAQSLIATSTQQETTAKSSVQQELELALEDDHALGGGTSTGHGLSNENALPLQMLEHSDSESILNVPNAREGMDDELTSSERSSVVGRAYFESMMCVLNTEDTEIPSLPTTPSPRSHSPLSLSSEFWSAEVKGGDKVETTTKEGFLKGLALDGLETSGRFLLDPQKGFTAAFAKVNEKDGAIPLESSSGGAVISRRLRAAPALYSGPSFDGLDDSRTSAQEDPEECLESEEEMPSFSDVESMILDMDLDAAFDEDASARAESRRVYKKFRKTLMRLEQGANAALDRSLTLRGAIACLYGHYSRHYITTNKVLVGRMTEDNTVDIDLGKEGRANKVSRRQATIKLKEDGAFYLKNLGKRAITVNNISIPSGQHAKLGSNGLIEVGGIRFIFESNQQLVRQRVAEMTTAQLPS